MATLATRVTRAKWQRPNDPGFPCSPPVREPGTTQRPIPHPSSLILESHARCAGVFSLPPNPTRKTKRQTRRYLPLNNEFGVRFRPTGLRLSHEWRWKPGSTGCIVRLTKNIVVLLVAAIDGSVAGAGAPTLKPAAELPEIKELPNPFAFTDG